HHAYMEERADVKAVGVVLVTNDKGLCGGLNTNITRLTLARLKEFGEQGIKVQATALGNKGLGFLTRIGADLVSQEVQLGDTPNLERLIGAIKVQLDDFVAGKIDAVYLATNRFVNTMKQDPSFVRLMPLPSGLSDPFQTAASSESEQEKPAVQTTQSNYGWDYSYEPDAKSVIDDLLL